jgi:diketogulonate reductase-like aldo/keto reductase
MWSCRLAENADVFNFVLSAEDMAAIDRLGVEKKQRLVNPPFRANGTSVFTD